MEKTLKKLAKVIDHMMDHVALFGGPSVVSNDDLDHYLDPVFYLIFCAEQKTNKRMLTDKEFVEWVYTEMMPQEIPYDLNFLPFAKLAIEDFYYCMYKEQHITKEQYQEIIFVLAEKQPVFYSRMPKPHFWSSEKKAAMLEMLHDVEPEDHDLVPIEHPYENQRSPKIVPFPIKKVPEASEERIAAYQIRIDLEGFKPPIWRRMLIPAGISYEQLHNMIQIAFQWQDSQLYLFLAGNNSIDVPNTEPTNALVIDHDFQTCQTLTYIYDMGADWTHKIKIEKILTAAEAGETVTPDCLKAVGDVPNEEQPEEQRESVNVETINEELRDYWESDPSD